MLSTQDVAGIVRPACPRCGRVVRIDKPLDGQRVCRTCIAHTRIEECARCGARREPATRDEHGRPLCPNCLVTDPNNLEVCLNCGRRRPVSLRCARRAIWTSSASRKKPGWPKQADPQAFRPQGLFYAQRNARDGVPNNEIKLREQIAALQKTNQSLRDERDGYRVASETFARALHVLTIENDNFRRELANPTATTIKPLRPSAPGRSPDAGE